MYNSKICETALVRVLSLNDLRQHRDDQYAIVIRGRQNDTKSGCRCCDFKDGTVSFYRPTDADTDDGCGEMECMPKYSEDDCGLALLFSKELLKCSESAWQPEDFSFFSYYYKESLHVSHKEKEKLESIISAIMEEQEWGFDKYSCRLILREIEILLVYCKRFYDRQFQIRSEACLCLMGKIEEAAERSILNSHSADPTPQAIEEISKAAEMSAAYMSDYVMHGSGLTMKDFLQRRQLEMARRALMDTDKCTCHIAKELGYSSARQMRIVFESVYGMTPKEFRKKDKY